MILYLPVLRAFWLYRLTIAQLQKDKCECLETRQRVIQTCTMDYTHLYTVIRIRNLVQLIP